MSIFSFDSDFEPKLPAFGADRTIGVEELVKLGVLMKFRMENSVALVLEFFRGKPSVQQCGLYPREATRKRDCADWTLEFMVKASE